MGRPSVIVVGGGTAGLATAWALARRGASVQVLERHQHIHEFGSHGGYTRAIRHAYHEGASYVPLVREADRHWMELGERFGETLLVRSGLLEFGAPDDEDYASSIEACRIHEIDHDLLSAREARSRWPFSIPDGWGACLTPSGGYLRVVPCLNALRSEAQAAGASFRYGVRVSAIEPDGDDCARVRTTDGVVFSADAVVVAAGTGLAGLVDATPDPPRLRCLRRAVVWTRPATRLEELRGLPVWGAFVPEGFFYGFPWNDEGISGLKFACHRPRAASPVDDHVDPEAVDRSLREDDVAPLRAFVERYFPVATTDIVDHRVCMYTATDRWDFLVDRWHASSRVIVVGGLSGHGFKFAPALGRMAAEMVIDGAEAPEEFRRASHRATEAV